ncbi:MerR family transcriptional regulator [Cohnella sp. GbtcB17]|uniref:MerR family transcriptional regulator n=1 Tax=Cohnella sp. GbtcB17 TaxID=2824762 RepID=UPI001C3034FC|nr:MerR family transcriptional regulator [Cohnella sp. GbtcB17]
MENKYSSKQVSDETGLSIHTLRYYEQIGLIEGIERDENGYRRYSEADMIWFQVLNYFRAMGMSIREMKSFTTLHNGGISKMTARIELMETYRSKVIDQMKELEKTLEKIDYKIHFFKEMERLDKTKQEK